MSEYTEGYKSDDDQGDLDRGVDHLLQPRPKIIPPPGYDPPKADHPLEIMLFYRAGVPMSDAAAEWAFAMNKLGIVLSAIEYVRDREYSDSLEVTEDMLPLFNIVYHTGPKEPVVFRFMPKTMGELQEIKDLFDQDPTA